MSSAFFNGFGDGGATQSADAATDTFEFPSSDLPLRGNFFARGTYVRTNVHTGVSRDRTGTRICTLPNEFLLGFHKAIAEECGPAAETVLKSCGVRWGAAYAQRLSGQLAEFYGQPVSEFATAEFFATLVEAFGQNGWGRLQVDLTYHDRGVIVAIIDGAIMASLLGKASKPADTLIAGTLAGFFRELTGEDLDCVQTQCSACKAKDSRFVITLASRLASAPEWVSSGLSHGEILVKLLASRG